MPPPLRLLSAGVLGVLLLSGPPGALPEAAQNGQAQSVQPFQAAANFVRVDVYATSKGAPVLDLDRDDFSLVEDGVPQALDSFERVFIRSRTTAAAPAPSTVAESRAAVASSRARVFVLFLDVNHVEDEANRLIKQPLINALDRLIGPDDLVAVMTPEMSGADITFDHRTDSIADMLSRHWDWGERAKERARTPRERAIQACFPGTGPTPTCADDDRGVADEIIDRLRERETLDAIGDLVDHVRGLRDERKAVLVISDGWRLFRADASLSRRLYCRAPLPTAGIDPGTGRLSVQPRDQNTGANTTGCEADRMEAAGLDDDAAFRSILNRANRANVSFYAIDPRGLAVFDTQLYQPSTGLPAPGKPVIPGVVEDAARLRTRQTALRDMAAATDGLAVMNSNDLDAGLRRVTDDLSSYYLLSYYSTGKLDGKFHSISVRVKRPGVDVRARRGYQAATAADLRSMTARAAPSTPAPGSRSADVAAAVGAIGAGARDARVRVAAPSVWPDTRVPRWYVTGEVSTEEMWRGGAQVIATIATPGGETIATGRATLAAGQRAFRIALPGAPGLAPGEYQAQVRFQPSTGLAPSEMASAAAPLLQSPGTAGALVSRRGPTTANRDVPTVDVRFRRTERIRADVPDRTGTVVSARVLDRNGSPLQVPVAVTEASDEDGVRWQSAQLTLAPLAVGDYVIELARQTTDSTGDPQLTLVPFRIVP